MSAEALSKNYEFAEAALNGDLVRMEQARREGAEATGDSLVMAACGGHLAAAEAILAWGAEHISLDDVAGAIIAAETNGYHVLAARFRHRVPNAKQTITFGAFELDPRECFHETRLSRAIVNSKPLVQGHVLIIPKRKVERLAGLTSEELADIWTEAVLVGEVISEIEEAPSVTYAIQDGPEAGQTVHHVHIHIVPRRPGDMKRDDVYKGLADECRESRPSADMYAEAARYAHAMSLQH